MSGPVLLKVLSILCMTMMQWAYGITCWEIISGGQVPYAGISPTDILTLLQNGDRLEAPQDNICDKEM